MALVLPALALAFGADLIEKHVTLDRAAKGFDYESALEPETFEKGIPGGRTVLYARLPVQLLFIAWAYLAGKWD